MSVFTRIGRLIVFACWFAAQVVRANARTVHDIINPTSYATPIVLRLETRCRTDVEIALLSILISLTPGTLVLAKTKESARGETDLFVHALYLSRDQVLAELQDLEGRLLRALRAKEAS